MKKILQKNYDFKTLGVFLVIALLLFGSNTFGQTSVESGGNTIVTFPPGTNSWTPPAGVTSIQVEAWGGGGGGGGATSSAGRAGGGGAGGAYVKYTGVTVSSVAYSVTAGAAGIAGGSGSTNSNGGNGTNSTVVFGATTITAVGGIGGNGNSLGSNASNGNGNGAGAGGPAVSTGNSASATNSFYGGAGANGVASTRSGGGGGAAGESSNGGTASSVAVTGGVYGGANASPFGVGANGNSTTAGAAGNLPGGGGAGGYATASTGRAGGTGGAGRLVITYVTPITVNPTVTLGAASLPVFTNTAVGASAASINFSLSGANLDSNDIVITAPANFAVSSDDINFSSSISLTPSSGTVSGTTIYVRFSPTGNGSLSGNVVVSNALVASQNVAVSGNLSSYYYKGSGSLADLSSWSGTSDLTGSTQPSAFNISSVSYRILSGDAITTVPWTFTGTLVVGSSAVAGVTLTIASAGNISGTIDLSSALSGFNKLVVQNTTFLTSSLGTLNASSTIECQVDVATTKSTFANNIHVNGGTFSWAGQTNPTISGNVTVTAGTFLTNSATINGNVTVSGTSFLSLNTSTASRTLILNGNFDISGTGGIKNSGVGTERFDITLGGTAKTISNTAIGNDLSKTNLLINGSYSLSNNFKYNTTEASARTFTIGASGNLNLNGKMLSLDNSGSIAITAGGILTANGAGSTIEFFGASAQAIPTTILYQNIILSGGSKTIPAELSIANDLAINGPTAAIAQDLTVNNNLTVGLSGALTLSTGKNLTVKNALINNATAGSAAVVIESGANLIQGATTTVNANTGNITVKRNSNGLFRLDFAMWSSPVFGTQALGAIPTDFSPLTTAGRFYTYNSGTDQYNAVAPATPFTTGTGYLIRMPNEDPSNLGGGSGYALGTAPLTFLGAFTGVPNNGTINLATVANKYNGVGNPYPSVIDAELFKASNSDINTLYFWRKTNNLNQGGSPTTSYATYNIATATGVSVAPDGAAIAQPTITPDKFIQVGQGFLFSTAQSSVVFNNAMRVVNNGNKILKTKVVERNRIWLNLSNSNWPINQMALCYMDGATQGVDDSDSKYFNDSQTALTSLINNEEFVIQGRPAFDPSDVVPLAFKTTASGDYTIALDHFDGVFATGQDVYLVDSKTGIATDLKAGTYTFSAAIGVDNARFSLKYQKTLKVNAAAFNDNSVLVYKNKGTLYVNSDVKAINNIKVYDVQGRLMAEQKNVKTNSATINNLKANNQVLIVKISGEDNSVVTKKVMN